MKRDLYARLNKKMRECAPRTGATLPRCGSSMLALAVSAALCATPQSYAQQASGSLSLEEIVVTATKRKVNLQDVGQSITVLSTADIEKAGYKEMGDYIKDLPSVTLAQQQPGRNDIVFRGVSTGIEEFYSDAQAGVYLDEQPITTNATQVSPYLVDIERVESLPGPQGTLFGSSAETGVLRIITNKPDPSGFSGQYSVTGFATKGGAGSYEVDGHLNIPLIDDKLTARIVGFYADNGGWIDNVYGTDLAQESNNANVVKSNTNDWKISGARLAALWKVNDSADVLFNLTTQNDTTKGDWSNDPYLGDAKITRFIENSRHDNWWQAAATVTADLGFAELKSATAYFARHMTYTEDNMTYEQYKAKYYGSYYATPTYNGKPGYNLYDTRILSTGVDNGRFTKSTVFNDQHQYRVSQEFRLTSKGTSRLQWLGGLFYERVHDYWYYGTQNLQLMNTYAWAYANSVACDPANAGLGVSCPLAPTSTIYAQWFDRTVTQTAVFGEISYKLTDPWTVTAGGRWFNYKRDISQHYDQPLGLPAELGSPGSNGSSGNDSATLFKLGTQYKYNPDGMVYLLFSEGYRLGGENTARAAATGNVPLKYNPDKLLNYEGGIKSQWWDRRLTLNASLFYMKWSQIQLESSTGVYWKHGTINGGGADNKGIELSGSLRATKQLTLDFNLIKADPKLTEQVVYPSGRTIPVGTQLVGAPKFKASAGLQYNFGWKPEGGDLWARFDYSYQSLEYQSLLYASIDYQNAVRDLGLIPGIGRIEPWSFGKLQAGVTMPNKLEVTLTLDNVWNSKGANWVTTSESYYAAQFSDPRFHNMPAQFRPQNIGLTIRKNF